MIGVGISTVQGRHAAAIQLAETLRSFGADVVIIIQRSDCQSTERQPGLTIVRVMESGLSKSRNAVFEAVTSEYIWFIDDDVSVDREMWSRLVAGLSAARPDIFVGRIRCSNKGGYYKKYSQLPIPIRLRVLRCSSIEIVASRNFIERHEIRFNERLGLGADFPSGEENFFLLECLDHNADVFFSAETIVAHPCVEETRSILKSWSSTGIPQSKGILARKVGRLLGLFVLFMWTTRALFKKVSLRDVCGAYSGFWNGRHVK